MAKLLTKVAIENKYGNSESLWDMTEKLKLALKDMWYARYPQLVELKESFHQISVDHFGSRMKGFDTKMYQAAETMREIYKTRKRLSEAKRVLTNYALKIIHTEGADDVNKDRLRWMMRDDAILSSKRMFHHILADYQHKKSLKATRSSRYTNEPSISQDLQSQTAKFPTRGEELSEPLRLMHHKSQFSHGAILNERLIQTAENSRGTTIEFPIPKLRLSIARPTETSKKSEILKKKGSFANDVSIRKSSRKRKDMSFQNSNSENPYPLDMTVDANQRADVMEDIQDFQQIGLHNFVHKLKDGDDDDNSMSSNQDSSEADGPKSPPKPPVIIVEKADAPKNSGLSPKTPPLGRVASLRKHKSISGAT